MKLEKGLVGKEKSLLLYEWINLVNQMHPKKRTHNPHEYLMDRFKDKLILPDRLLIHYLTDSMTRINHKERELVKGKFLSSREDNFHAFHLVLGEFELTPKLLEMYDKLKKIFKDHSFTNEEAALVLNCSVRSLQRHFRVFFFYELIEAEGDLYEKRYFKIPELSDQENKTPMIESRSIFDQAFEEWEDYEGWQDFNQRI